MVAALKLVFVILILTFIDGISGHGMVMDPIGRGSRWRIDRSAPANYDDMSNFCGGLYDQWSLYGGRCGLCGDNFGDPQPRKHENGGTYGKGVVVKSYSEGAAIRVTVKLTTNHYGYFVFKICNLDNEPESDACFDRYPVDTEFGSVYTLQSDKSADYTITIYLPRGLNCYHCALQWTYTVANSWGTCTNGTSGKGCGPQETFRTCSDISIRPFSFNPLPEMSKFRAIYQPN